MKKIPALCIFFAATNVHAQNKFDGLWEGRLAASVSLRIALEFKTQPDGHISALLYSPDQVKGSLPVDTAYIAGNSIVASARRLGLSFKGALINDSTINGVFRQGGTLPLTLKKTVKIASAQRPQTPHPPYSYNSNEVSFYNADSSIKFAGTVTSPENGAATWLKAPAIILITGSGPQDRDETILQHKPFAVIADYLTQKGFVVLRTDDRGTGKTTGIFATATTADFAKDVEAGINYLKTLPGVDTNKIGLIGHSEGGMIAPMVASRRKDIKYIVLLAGPGIPIAGLMAAQVEAVNISAGMLPATAVVSKKLAQLSIEAVQKNTDTAERNKFIGAKLKQIAKGNDSALTALGLVTTEAQKKYIDAQVAVFNTAWFKYFLAFHPQQYLQQLGCDVLALNGSKDIQVLPAANLAGIKAALKKSRSKRWKAEELPGLNHLFQTCKQCDVAEYGELEETFSPAALQVMGDWLVAWL